MGMFVDTTGQTLSDVASFVSPYSNVTSSTCLSFNYLMDNVPSDTSLEIFFNPTSNEDTRSVVWTNPGGEGSSWIAVTVELGALGTGYFEVEGVAGSSSAVIGLDDVIFGHCDSHPSSGAGSGTGQTSVGKLTIFLLYRIIMIKHKHISFNRWTVDSYNYTSV